MTFNQTQFEKRVQRAQKAIAAIGKNLAPETVTPELIAKVTGFLANQVTDLGRDLSILERSGVKRGVFSLDAPADPTPAEPLRITLPGHTLPALSPEFPPSPVQSALPTVVKASDVVNRTAPPAVIKEVLKTAEDAPDRVRVFGGGKTSPPASGEGDVDFQEE